MTDEPTPSSPSDFESYATTRIEEHFEAQRPPPDERQRLLNEHSGHLVRDTTSQLTIDDYNFDTDGIELDATVEIPDTYCFSCGEWIGVSGVDLSGTPRSRKDAYYLHGEPDSVRELRSRVRDHLRELGKEAQRDIDHINTPTDALAFIETEIEHMKDDLADS